MRLSLLPDMIAISIMSRIPLMIHGSPGTAKSASVKSTCRALSKTLLDVRCVNKDAIDIPGLPYVENRTTCYATPATWPREPNHVIFLDELPQASVLTMNALSELILDRTIGGKQSYQLPQDTAIIAAGNRRSDKAGVNVMPTNISGRFWHLEADLDPDEWTRGNMQGFPDPVINIDTPSPEDMLWGRHVITAFIRARPGLLNVFTAAEIAQHARPNPRTWDFLQQLLPYARHRPDLQLDMAQGTVGEGPGIELKAFLDVVGTMPNPDLCLAQPTTAPIPDPNHKSSPAVTYALCAALASKVVKANADNFFAYLQRLPQEYAHVAVRDALNKDASLVICNNGKTWMAKHSKYVISGSAA